MDYITKFTCKRFRDLSKGSKRDAVSENLNPNSSIKPKTDVKYIWNNSYIWTAVLDQSEEWSSQ